MDHAKGKYATKKIVEREDWDLEILERYPCDTLEELKERTEFYKMKYAKELLCPYRRVGKDSPDNFEIFCFCGVTVKLNSLSTHLGSKRHLAAKSEHTSQS